MRQDHRLSVSFPEPGHLPYQLPSWNHDPSGWDDARLCWSYTWTFPQFSILALLLLFQWCYATRWLQSVYLHMKGQRFENWSAFCKLSPAMVLCNWIPLDQRWCLIFSPPSFKSDGVSNRNHECLRPIKPVSFPQSKL